MYCMKSLGVLSHADRFANASGWSAVFGTLAISHLAWSTGSRNFRRKVLC